MLLRDGAVFTTCRSRYDELQGRGGELKIVVRIKPLGWDEVIEARLDTGAAWSMLDREIAEGLALLDGDGEMKEIKTWAGVFVGRLERVPILLLGDAGESLRIEATMWVSPEWSLGNFLGYRGLLERIRFGLDPDDRTFYFGESERGRA